MLLSLPASAGQLYFYHNDHLGTPKAITDTEQNVVWRADSRPFGDTTITQQTINNPLRLPGQYFDDETGLHYNYFRDYDPSIGRYLQSDPIGLSGGLNTYGYAYQNPVSLSDPTGLCPWCVAWGVYKLGAAAYDAYQTYNAVTDPCATTGDKLGAVGALVAGAVSPLGKGGNKLLNMAGGSTRVIGRQSDLGTPGVIKAGEKPLDFHVVRRADGTLDQRATWYNNHSALRLAMRENQPIRDVSPGDTGGQFLNGERMQLEHRGWTQQSTNGETWYVPPTH